MPELPDVLLAAVLGLLGAAVGLASGRLVPMFPRHDPDPDDPAPPPPPGCPHCGAEIPFVRWLPVVRVRGFALRGRCPACRTALPPAPAVVAATAAVYVLIGLRLGAAGAAASPLWLAALLFLGGVGVLLAVIDVRVHRLPNVLVLPSYPVALALVVGAAFTAPAAAASGAAAAAHGDLVRALIGMAGLAAFYWVLWFIYPAGMGWGDVKLSGLLGLYLGWGGLSGVVSGTFLAFLFSAVLGLGLMAVGRATRKTQIPLGPFMIGGALAVILLGDPAVLLG
jgi:leader peptidase (prepilin peptidase)/N-methyltransferase